MLHSDFEDDVARVSSSHRHQPPGGTPDTDDDAWTPFSPLPHRVFIDEVLTEIFSFFPLSGLLRLRLISNAWNALIVDHPFGCTVLIPETCRLSGEDGDVELMMTSRRVKRLFETILAPHDRFMNLNVVHLSRSLWSYLQDDPRFESDSFRHTHTLIFSRSHSPLPGPFGISGQSMGTMCIDFLQRLHRLFPNVRQIRNCPFPKEVLLRFGFSAKIRILSVADVHLFLLSLASAAPTHVWVAQFQSARLLRTDISLPAKDVGFWGLMGSVHNQSASAVAAGMLAFDQWFAARTAAIDGGVTESKIDELFVEGSLPRLTKGEPYAFMPPLYHCVSLSGHLCPAALELALRSCDTIERIDWWAGNATLFDLVTMESAGLSFLLQCSNLKSLKLESFAGFDVQKIDFSAFAKLEELQTCRTSVPRREQLEPLRLKSLLVAAPSRATRSVVEFPCEMVKLVLFQIPLVNIVVSERATLEVIHASAVRVLVVRSCRSLKEIIVKESFHDHYDRSKDRVPFSNVATGQQVNHFVEVSGDCPNLRFAHFDKSVRRLKLLVDSNSVPEELIATQTGQIDFLEGTTDDWQLKKLTVGARALASMFGVRERIHISAESVHFDGGGIGDLKLDHLTTFHPSLRRVFLNDYFRDLKMVRPLSLMASLPSVTSLRATDLMNDAPALFPNVTELVLSLPNGIPGVRRTLSRLGDGLELWQSTLRTLRMTFGDCITHSFIEFIKDAMPASFKKALLFMAPQLEEYEGLYLAGMVFPSAEVIRLSVMEEEQMDAMEVLPDALKKFFLTVTRPEFSSDEEFGLFGGGGDDGAEASLAASGCVPELYSLLVRLAKKTYVSLEML